MNVKFIRNTKIGEVSTADDKSKHDKPSPSITRTYLLTLALYMSHSGDSFGYRCIAVSHTCCVCFGLDYIQSCTVYTLVQQYVLVDYCCFYLTSVATTAVCPYINFCWKYRRRSLYYSPKKEGLLI